MKKQVNLQKGQVGSRLDVTSPVNLLKHFLRFKGLVNPATISKPEFFSPF